MAQGDIDSRIVESPITAAKINTAAAAAITATEITAALSIISFNQGRSVSIVAVEGPPSP